MPFQGQAVPILVGVASWSFTSWQKQKYERKQQELNQITEQIRNFYGPLSGNSKGSTDKNRSVQTKWFVDPG